MNDREMLELAAKAAGIRLDYWREDYQAFSADSTMMVWNPLNSDGDALRLAVNLGLVIEIGYAARGFLAVRTNTDNWQEFREAWGSDPNAATRRAIVRAAAAIGEKME